MVILMVIFSLISDIDTAITIPPKAGIEEKAFLKLFLMRFDKKLIISKKDYTNYEKSIEQEESIGRSLKDFSLHQFRGLITFSPDDEGADKDDLIRLVERNYATPQWVVVDNPEKYICQFKRFNCNLVVSPRRFMLNMQADDDKEVIEFCKDFSEQWEKRKKS